MAQRLVYHWKHGWIPLDRAAALSKAHGSEKGAAKWLGHGAPKSGVPAAGDGKSHHLEQSLQPKSAAKTHNVLFGERADDINSDLQAKPGDHVTVTESMNGRTTSGKLVGWHSRDTNPRATATAAHDRVTVKTDKRNELFLLKNVRSIAAGGSR